ncbi:hypothetical protein ACFX13_000244 [Malus domestica]
MLLTMRMRRMLAGMPKALDPRAGVLTPVHLREEIGLLVVLVFIIKETPAVQLSTPGNRQQIGHGEAFHYQGGITPNQGGPYQSTPEVPYYQGA